MQPMLALGMCQVILKEQRASQQAGKWTKIAFWIGLAGIVIYFVMVLIFGSFTTYNIFNPYTYGY